MAQLERVQSTYGNFCKIGKFYELFHSDADIFTELTEAPYMKGLVAHTGFPANRVDDFVEKLQAKFNEIGILYPKPEEDFEKYLQHIM